VVTDIYVQVVPDAESAGDLSPESALTERLSQRADEIAATLADVADRLKTGLDARTAEPSGGDGWNLAEVQLRFSLDLQAEAGVVVARTSTRAAFVASLTWKSR
jgi:hypothetical protein